MSEVAAYRPPADYEIEIRIRNARILGLMRRAGIPTVSQLAHRTGIGASTIGKLVNLKLSPLSKNKGGEYLSIVHRIATALHCHPDDMFTDQQRHTFLESNKCSVQLAEAEVGLHLSAIMHMQPDERLFKIEQRQALRKALDILRPRERQVIIARFGLDGGKERTLDETLKELSDNALGTVTRERIRQIERGALKKLARPAVRNALRRAS